MPWLTLIQIVLLVLWYTVEQFQTLSAWIIFIPAIIIAIRTVLVLAIFILAAWANS